MEDSAAAGNANTEGAGNDTAEWTKQFKDPMGRAFKRLYADGAAELSFYDGKGRLWKSVDADGVVRLSAYNDLGDLEYSAVDMDRNGRIDLAGTDQVTKSIRDFATQDGSVVARTRTYVWPENGKDAPYLAALNVQAANA